MVCFFLHKNQIQMTKTDQKLPAVLQTEVKNSGIQLNKAETIASNYAPLMIQAQDLGNQLKKLKIGNPDDVEPAKRIRLDLGKICSEVSKIKDNDKEIIKIESKFIMGLYHSVEGFARLTQKDAEAIEKHAEQLEEARLERLKEQRIKEVAKFGVDGELLNLHMMQDDIFDNYLNGVKLNHQAIIDAEEKAAKEAEELERKFTLFNEREKQLLPFAAYAPVYDFNIDTTEDDFNAMLKNSKQMKVDSIKKQEEQAKENARLTKEAEEREEAAEKQRKVDEKARKDQEAKLAAEKEKNEALEAAEAKRQADAKAEKENAAKVARDQAKAPDIQQIKLSIEQCVLNPLKLKDEVMQETFDVINKKFEGFKKWSDELIKGAE